MNKKILIASVLTFIVGAGAAYALASESGKPIEFTKDQLNEGDLDTLGSLPLEEAKKRLNYIIVSTQDDIDTIERMSNMSIKLSVATTNTGRQNKEIQYIEAHTPVTSADILKQTERFKNKPLSFEQVVGTKSTHIYVDVAPLIEKLETASNGLKVNQVNLEVDKLYFKDGEAKKINGEDRFAEEKSNGFLLEGVKKPVDKISLNLNYESFDQYKKITLNKANPKVSLDSGQYFQIAAFTKDGVSLVFSTTKDETYLIQGMTESGKALRQTSMNSNSVPTKEIMDAMGNMLKAFKKTRENINDFKDSQSLQAHLENVIKKNAVKAESSLTAVRANYHFEDAPEEIVIYVFEGKKSNTLAVELKSVPSTQELYLAEDTASKKMGFVDKTGTWVIPAKFEEISITDFDSIYRAVSAGSSASKWEEKYYYLAPKSRELKVLPFEIIKEKINDDLVVVEKEINGSYGIYSVKQQKFVIPMKFVNPKIEGNLFFASLGEKTYGFTRAYGVYTLDGKTVLEPKYLSIEVKEGFIYAETKNDVFDVFDQKGQKINADGTQVIGQYYENQPILIEDIAQKRRQFMDQKGRILPFSLPYDTINPFSNGMAIVGSKNKFGAIDLQGKLKVPLQYSAIRRFQKNLALASPAGAGNVVLIDKENKVVKAFGNLRFSKASYNSNDASYVVYENQNSNVVLILDADGNVVKK